MLTPTGLVGLLVVLGLSWVVFHLVTQAGTTSALDRRERAELDDLRALVDDLKETAWDHRELDSPLSTIVIDKIRTYERHRRELGS